MPPTQAFSGLQREVMLPAAATAPVVGADLDPTPMPELSTETSTTTLLPSGEYEASMATTPINYLDSMGEWVPIDTTLVNPSADSDAPSNEQGGVPVEEVAVENAAATHTISIPENPAATPLRIAAEDVTGVPNGQAWVTLSMDGLAGAPAISHDTATYDQVEDADEVQLKSTTTGLKETIVLEQPPVGGEVLEYRYQIQTSAGMSPRLAAGGVVEFVRDDAPGQPAVFTIPVGNMFDSAQTITIDDSQSKGPAYTNDVAYGLAKVPPPDEASGGPTGPTWQFTVSPDMGWLTDPARVYPVMIDPDIELVTNDQARDCSLWQDDANAIRCGNLATHLHAGRVSSGTTRRRSVLYFNALGNENTNQDTQVIPADAEITHGNVQLWLDPTQTTNAVETAYVLNRTNKPFTNGATWNSPDNRPDTNPWGAQIAGGGPTGPDSQEIRLSGNESSTWRYFNVDDIVRSWHAGTFPNDGLVLKQKSEAVYSQIAFYSSSTNNFTNRHPRLNVRYRPADPVEPNPDGTETVNAVPPTAINDPLQSTPLTPGQTRRIDVSDVYSRAGIADPLDVDRMRLDITITNAAGNLSAMLYNSDLEPFSGPQISADDATAADRIQKTVTLQQASDDHISIVNQGSSDFNIALTFTGWLGWEDTTGDTESEPPPDDITYDLPDISVDDPILDPAPDSPGADAEVAADDGELITDGGVCAQTKDDPSFSEVEFNEISAEVPAPEDADNVAEGDEIYCAETLPPNDPEIQAYLDDAARQDRDAAVARQETGEALLRCPGGENGWRGNRWYSCRQTHMKVRIVSNRRGVLGGAKVIIYRRINADPTNLSIQHHYQVRLVSWWGKGSSVFVYSTVSCNNCSSGGTRKFYKPADYIHSGGANRISRIASGNFGIDGVTPLNSKTTHFRLTTRVTAARGKTNGGNRARLANSPVYRCDRLALFNRNGGCVIGKYVPVMDFPVSRAPQSAGTIRNRISRSPFPGKVGGFKLERETSRAERKKNRRAAGRYCRVNDRREPGEDCDEFPFASTKQGCAGWPRLCYGRYIGARDNSTGGGLISGFYGRNRVFGGEGFWIRLDGVSGLPRSTEAVSIDAGSSL